MLRFLPHFDQACAQELFKQRYQVAVATFGLDIVFLQQNLTNIRNPARCLQQLPNVRSNWVKSIVNAISHIEDGRFGAKTAGDLVLCHRDNRLLRKIHLLRVQRDYHPPLADFPPRHFNDLSSSEQSENGSTSCLVPLRI